MHALLLCKLNGLAALHDDLSMVPVSARLQAESSLETDASDYVRADRCPLCAIPALVHTSHITCMRTDFVSQQPNALCERRACITTSGCQAPACTLTCWSAFCKTSKQLMHQGAWGEVESTTWGFLVIPAAACTTAGQEHAIIWQCNAKE